MTISLRHIKCKNHRHDVCKIIYHPQSGWFEDTPLKGGTEEGYPLKGVHEGTCLLEAEQHAGTTLALLGSHHGSVYSLSVAPRVALGVWV
jgi:hypothetical protein